MSDLTGKALRLASKGVQINDGHTYNVHAHDLVEYAETIRALVCEIESRDEYAAIFDAPQGAWREPLGALRLTLAGPPEEVDVRRAQHECEQLVKVLNGVKA